MGIAVLRPGGAGAGGRRVSRAIGISPLAAAALVGGVDEAVVPFNGIGRHREQADVVHDDEFGSGRCA
jgi:hypothetical protein